MNFSKTMDALNESSLFNASGLATVLSFFGLNAANFAKIADINIILLVIIGFLSLGFTIMKMYREFLLTRRLKADIKKDKEKKK
jgi:hypothetical protein